MPKKTLLIGPLKMLYFQTRRAGTFPDLEHRGHEDGAAHQSEDHEAGEALLPDAQEFGLFAGRRALRLQLQAVDVRDGQHGGGHKPRQAHHRAHAQHDPHHKQVQVVAATFLQGDQRPAEDKKK